MASLGVASVTSATRLMGLIAALSLILSRISWPSIAGSSFSGTFG